MLRLVPKYANAFSYEIPFDLRSLFDPDATYLPFHQLLKFCSRVKERLIVTDITVNHVEEVTRGQAASSEWFIYGAGRSTALNVHVVLILLLLLSV